jgi:hypothetical protein
MPVIIATQEAEIRRISSKLAQGRYFKRPCLENAQHTKKELAEWLKR